MAVCARLRSSSARLCHHRLHRGITIFAIFSLPEALYDNDNVAPGLQNKSRTREGNLAPLQLRGASLSPRGALDFGSGYLLPGERHIYAQSIRHGHRATGPCPACMHKHTACVASPFLCIVGRCYVGETQVPCSHRWTRFVCDSGVCVCVAGHPCRPYLGQNW